MNILIAEDDRTTRALLESVLAQKGHSVVTVDDGQEALDALDVQPPPDLIIMDWVMPRVTGIDVVRKIRSNPDAVQPYIILVTMRDNADEIVEGLDAGADDYITKPFNREELRARVRAGERIMQLRERLLKSERDQVVIEMAGAAAHEINQPLTTAMGTIDLLMMQSPCPNEKEIQSIYAACDRISKIVARMRESTAYRTKPYVGDTRIVDLGSDDA